MKLLLLSSICGLLLFSFSRLESPKQDKRIPAVKVHYRTISVAKMDPENDSIVEMWFNNHSCTYQTNTKKLLFSYREVDENKKVVKTFSHPIIHYQSDSLVHQFRLNTGDGIANVLVWKDKRMVVIEAEDYNYIISK